MLLLNQNLTTKYTMFRSKYWCWHKTGSSPEKDLTNGYHTQQMTKSKRFGKDLFLKSTFKLCTIKICMFEHRQQSIYVHTPCLFITWPFPFVPFRSFSLSHFVWHFQKICDYFCSVQILFMLFISKWHWLHQIWMKKISWHFTLKNGNQFKRHIYWDWQNAFNFESFHALI